LLRSPWALGAEQERPTVMQFDELEWVREAIDRWLTENAMHLALGAALLLALASLFVAS
jgi:hypothetical protein